MLVWGCISNCFSQGKYGNFVLANSAEVTYTGRTLVSEQGEVTFDWVGTYFDFVLEGESVAMRASDSGESYYNVFVDNQLYKNFVVSTPDTVIQLVSNLSKNGKHVIRVQKRSEGEFGCTTIHGFVLYKKSTLYKSPQRKERFIEFIGDSYTVGYGADGTHKDQPFTVATENADKTYACILARYFQSDYALIAHSGRGAARNYGDSLTSSRYTMKDFMLRTLDSDTTARYRFDQYTPDLVVINLGLNDFSTQPAPSKTEFKTAYRRIIRQVRDAYGSKVKILCVVPRLGDQYLHYISDLLSQLDNPNLRHTAPLHGVINDDSDMGAAWHPGEVGHQKIATFLVPYIATLMDWPLQDRTIR